jgi:hypothetical protein
MGKIWPLFLISEGRRERGNLNPIQAGPQIGDGKNMATVPYLRRETREVTLTLF